MGSISGCAAAAAPVAEAVRDGSALPEGCVSRSSFTRGAVPPPRPRVEASTSTMVVLTTLACDSCGKRCESAKAMAPRSPENQRNVCMRRSICCLRVALSSTASGKMLSARPSRQPRAETPRKPASNSRHVSLLKSERPRYAKTSVSHRYARHLHTCPVTSLPELERLYQL